MAKSKTYSIRFEVNQLPSKWLEKQGNKTLSLEMLIRAAVKKYGYTDLPASVIDAVGLQIDEPDKDRMKPEPANDEPEAEDKQDAKTSETPASDEDDQENKGDTAEESKPDVDLGMLTNLK